MDVIQTGTNIATVKISELPKSTETAGRATLATNKQTNQSEALELTKVAEATQTALDAAQTANQSSQTALASAATANQAAQAADTARENIAGDLAQKSSMFTGAIMGKGVFRKDDTSIFNDSGYTIRVVFKTSENQDTTLEQCVYATSNNGYSPRVTLSKDGFIYAHYRGSGVSYTKKYTPNTLYEVIIVSSNADCRAYCNNTKYGPYNRADTYISPTSLSIGAYLSKASPFLGKIVSAQIFNFPFSDDDAAASWNGGHPELWRAPDAWRKEDSEQRVVVDLIPASLTPTVWKDISGQGNDIPYVPFDSNPNECEMAYENMGFPDTIIGTGAPAVIPNFIGQRYIDTTNEAEYTAFGTSSASDWK